MPSWNNIARLTDQKEKQREAAFEAQMLALVARDKPQPRPAPASPPPAPAAQDGIQISVTTNGRTNVFRNLAMVPEPVRQQILNAWCPSPPPTAPPPIVREDVRPVPVAPRKSRRVARTLNLFLPGAGQFYLGQPVVGGALAVGFVTCFIVMIGLFLRAYVKYLNLSTSGDILEAGTLERLAPTFPTGTLLGLLAVALVIYFTSAIHLGWSQRPDR